MCHEKLQRRKHEAIKGLLGGGVCDGSAGAALATDAEKE